MGIQLDGERLAGVGIHVDIVRVDIVAGCVRVDMVVGDDIRRLVEDIRRLVVGIRRSVVDIARTGQMQRRSTPTM